MGEMRETFVDKMECLVHEVGDGSVGLGEKAIEEVLVEILTAPFSSMLTGVTTIDRSALIPAKKQSALTRKRQSTLDL